MTRFGLAFLLASVGLLFVQFYSAAQDAPTSVAAADWRCIEKGLEIPDENYADQPYIVVTKDGNWLCTLTSGVGEEGKPGQHVVATISADKGKTWTPLIDIEPADGPEASWVVPLVVPGGRVYAFYTFNGDNVRTLNEKPIRSDTFGWYAYRYSDDGGRTWSGQRYRLPMRVTDVDRGNDWQGQLQLFWGICKPIISGESACFSFTKLGKFMLDNGEGWMFRSNNILSEADPDKLEWQLLPEGEKGIRSPDLGSIQEEHNIVSLENGDLYCMYRTTTGYPAHSYSRDGGRTWTVPMPATYTPGGRRMKNPRACPRIWRTASGRYLFWFHNHSGKDFNDRNPAWLAGGIEKDGYIWWSQPEILLYAPDIKTRMSYPDFVEQEGRYWFTETQKTIARVHEVDPTLIEGLWTHGQTREVARSGLVLDLDVDTIAKGKAECPRLSDLSKGNGFSVECCVKFEDLVEGEILLDSRDPSGRGIALLTAAAGTVKLSMSDGTHVSEWDCDPGLLSTGKNHHLVFIVDGGPKIITVVVDGQLCDGGEARQFGWGRFTPEMGDVNGSGEIQLAPSLHGQLSRLRVYDRYLRTSEAIANGLAGQQARYHAGLIQDLRSVRAYGST